jgi:DNA-binding XRE family transcriptional regulator
MNEMTADITNFLYKYIINNNPFINEEDILSYEALNEHDLLITYKNGKKEIYDTYNNTSRRINHPDSENMNDSQMRLNFRRRLQTIMNRKWVTQDELAKRINSSQQMISRYLTGQSIPSALTIKKIADALDCNVNDFYDYFL